MPNELTLQQTQEYLPQPFAGVVANGSARMTDTFLEMHNQEQDYDWAILMQQRVSDFFMTHEYGHLVELQSVVCQSTICEIRGFTSDHDQYELIRDELQQQPWWSAFSSNNISGNNDENSMYFYLLAMFDRA